MTDENYLKKLADMQTQIKELVPDSLKENEERTTPRLIDADALLKAIVNYPYGYRGMIESEIENQPTVDAEPVRHGKWEEHKDYPSLAYLCSECGYFTTDKSHFCPNCGARMDAE